MVSGLHQPEYVGENYVLIFIKAVKLMYYNWGLPVLAFLLLTLVSSLFIKNIRYITLIMVIPPLIIWMLKYSADFRNLSFVVPFFSYVSAFGLIKIIEILKNKHVDSEFKVIDQVETSITSRQKTIGGVISILSVGLYFLFSSDLFFDLILQAHKLISIYYFQSYRINLLVDYTQYISIDYYQKVLSTMCLFVPTLYLLLVAKVRPYQLLILIGITAVYMNFTLIKKDDIFSHQQKQTEQIDARNYAEWMNTIIESSGFNKQVYTNFKAISEDKVPGNLKFIYLNKDEIEKYFSNENFNQCFFLKTDLLDMDLKVKINRITSKSKSKVLFDDGDYSLIIN
jgi:hypothetical protein